MRPLQGHDRSAMVSVADDAAAFQLGETHAVMFQIHSSFEALHGR